MKISTTYTRDYEPFHDSNCDPEDRSSHLYTAREDRIQELLGSSYVSITEPSQVSFLLLRDNSLTKVSIRGPTKISFKGPYKRGVILETESEVTPVHPKELTDLLQEQGFAS